MTRIAVTVIGTNLVMDYGTKEAAMAALEAMQLSAQETMSDDLMGLTQETIVGMQWATYRDQLRQMVASGKARNDPTLAIAVSLDALDGMLTDLANHDHVRAALDGLDHFISDGAAFAARPVLAALAERETE